MVDSLTDCSIFIAGFSLVTGNLIRSSEPCCSQICRSLLRTLAREFYPKIAEDGSRYLRLLTSSWSSEHVTRMLPRNNMAFVISF